METGGDRRQETEKTVDRQETGAEARRQEEPHGCNRGGFKERWISFFFSTDRPGIRLIGFVRPSLKDSAMLTMASCLLSLSV